MKLSIILETKEYEKAWNAFASQLQPGTEDMK